MYYEYWGLHKPPFDNVPDPSMYVDCHASMENAIAETLFAIEEGDECIAVIVGDVGLGKTMSLRMIIDSLDPERYRMALITNPGVSFGQLLQEIIGQLTGSQCLEKRKVHLLETFNRLLFSAEAEGRRVLVFIDEANAISPVNLENLRLLTNMQGDRRNLFTMVLAGQIEFSRRLEHPRRANLLQRIGTYCRIDRLESVGAVQKYVETRLLRAGASKQIFTDEAFGALWEQSGHGIPRLVNKICKLCLKAGETNRFGSISGETVEQIGTRFHKLAGPAVEKRRARTYLRKTKDVFGEDAFVRQDRSSEDADDRQDATSLAESEIVVVSTPAAAEAAMQASLSTPAGPPEETEACVQAGGVRAPLQTAEEEPAAEVASPDPSPAELLGFMPQGEVQPPPGEERDSEIEISIGDTQIRIRIPSHLLRQSRSASDEHRFRLAGGLAAETLRNNPHLVSSLSMDPVPIWLQIRDVVLDRMSHADAA
jgi:type II secretory pathway predicted ATPase ExeA